MQHMYVHHHDDGNRMLNAGRDVGPTHEIANTVASIQTLLINQDSDSRLIVSLADQLDLQICTHVMSTCYQRACYRSYIYVHLRFTAYMQ